MGAEQDPLAIAKAQRSTVERSGPMSAPLLSFGKDKPVEVKTGSSKRAEADVCFVFDTTGSMSDKIDGLIRCMSSFVDELASLGLDWRCTCVPFGDLQVPGDRVDAQLPFVATADAARTQLQHLPRFSGGSNWGESSVEALLAGSHKPWREGAVRVIVLLTDEPAHGGPQRSQEVLQRLRQREIICFVASPHQAYFIDWAARNGGQWKQIGASMDTTELLQLLRSLVTDVARVAHDVHQLAGGSVRRYLELEAGQRHPERRNS
jgi:hypothetical protein